MTDRPHSVSPLGSADAVAACEARAHHLYFERHDWAAAFLQWQLRARLGPPTIESQLALAHCQIVVGADADLPALGVAKPVAHGNGRRDAYAQLIRSCAWAYLMSGKGDYAAKLARLVAGIDPHYGSVYRHQIFAPADDPPVAIPARPETDGPLPFERDLVLDDASARAVLARRAGCRVLLFMPQMGPTASGMAEITLCRFLRSSLEELGIEHTIVESGLLAEDARVRIAETLRTAIATLRPDVIVCYDMMISGASAHADVQDAILDELHAARRDLGARLVYTYSDAWYDNMPAMLEAIVDHPDLFHVTFSGVLSRVTPAVAAKTLAYPYPCPDPRTQGAAVARRHGRGGFVGGLSWSNQARLVWCAEIERAGLPVDLHLNNISGFRTPADYAELIGSYPVSIDLTARISGDRVLTLRALEAPCYGSLLLGEASDDTAYFMRPFEHYVPFDSMAQLAGRLRQLLDDDALRDRITRAGSAWVRRHFTAAPFWARLFHRLDGAGAAPAAAARLRTQVHVSIPISPEAYLALARPLTPAARH